MNERPFLPPILDDIAEAAGVQAALLLMREYGGREVYIPLRAPDGHWLVNLVGREAADRICALFATRIDADREKSRHGERIVIPIADSGARGGAKRAAFAMLSKNIPANEVARAAGVCNRTVWNYKARVKDAKKKDQGRLF